MSAHIKIIIIGASGFQRSSEDHKVDCYEWEKIQKIKNVKDYHVVILNLLDSPPKNTDWSVFNKCLNVYVMREILFYSGRIYVLGDPRFSIAYEDENDEEDLVIPFLDWTGMKFSWDNSPGDTLELKTGYEFEHYDEYLRNLDRWDYSLFSVKLNEELLWHVYDKQHFIKSGWYFDLDHVKLAINRYGNALASRLTISIKRKEKQAYGVRVKTVNSFGPVVFLPKISLSTEETISKVLSDLCGLEIEVPEPPWIEVMEVPHQQVLDSKIEKTKGEILALNEELEGLYQKRLEVRSCLKLLFERGGALESIVRQICAELGAQVEEPTEPGKEDGWIAYQLGKKLLEGVLEVKCTKNRQFGQDGIRQLLDWVSRGLTLRQKKYKGIFIGTNSVEKALEERANAFSKSWKESAELAEICALKTEDLFRAYILHCEGRLDTNAFWSKVFSTKGIFESSFLGEL
jgi:hypothetical protein